MKVSDVMRGALELGACNQSGKATDWKSLCWLFFTPQGREFCERNNFPAIGAFREMKPYVGKYGVYVDAGDISLRNNANVGIIGDTVATLEYDDNTIVHKITLMHGAKAIIRASNFAVINLTNVNNCEVDIINDGTARILC